MVRPFRRGMFSRVGLNVGAPVAPAEVQPELLQARVARLLEARIPSVSQSCLQSASTANVSPALACSRSISAWPARGCGPDAARRAACCAAGARRPR